MDGVQKEQNDVMRGEGRGGESNMKTGENVSKLNKKGQVLGVIDWREVLFRGLHPDLEEVDRLGLGGIVLGVEDALARRSELDLATAEDLFVVEGVVVLEGP